MRNWKLLGQLPSGYEYRIINVDGKLLIVGINQDKPPIAFKIKEEKLIEVRVDLDED